MIRDDAGKKLATAANLSIESFSSFRIMYRTQELRGKVHVGGTYLRYLPYIDLPERQDKETDSPVSPTPKSRSRIEVRADHSLPNLPSCT